MLTNKLLLLAFKDKNRKRTGAGVTVRWGHSVRGPVCLCPGCCVLTQLPAHVPEKAAEDSPRA